MKYVWLATLLLLNYIGMGCQIRENKINGCEYLIVNPLIHGIMYTKYKIGLVRVYMYDLILC